MILLLTGCSANYNIIFEDDKIIDSIEIYENSSIINKATKEKEDETPYDDGANDVANDTGQCPHLCFMCGVAGFVESVFVPECIDFGGIDD